jgi:hypothetical protein
VPSGVERAFSKEPSANVREHAWDDGSGVRCAGACSGKVPYLCWRRLRRSLRCEAHGADCCCLCSSCFGRCRFPCPCLCLCRFPCYLCDTVCLVMRRSMKKGRAAVAPARKTTGAKLVAPNLPTGASMATGGARRCFWWSPSPPPPPPPISQLPSRERSGASRRSALGVSVDI